MEIILPPDLNQFTADQAKHHGFASAAEYVADLIAKQRERESRGWDWFADHLRKGVEADESEFHNETAIDVINRGKARMVQNG